MRRNKFLLVFLLLVLLSGHSVFAQDFASAVISFDTGEYGSGLKDYEVEIDQFFNGDAYSNRYGYNFNSWLLDGKSFDIYSEPITKNLKLVADWELKKDLFTVDPLIFRDTRFAEGYPKMELENGKKWILKVKLADSSEANPAKVYLIYDNNMREVDTKSVIHGHEGINDHNISPIKYSQVLLITDTKEHVINLNQSINQYSRLYGSAFVIDQNGETSSQPTVLIVPNRIAMESVENEDNFPECYNAIVSKDKGKILMEFNGEMNTSKTIKPEDFTFIGGPVGAKVISVNNKFNSSIYALIGVSGFENFADWDALKISYKGKDLMDLSGNIVNDKSFEYTNFKLYETPVVKKIVISEDGMNLNVNVEGTIFDNSDPILYLGNDKLKNIANNGTDWSNMSINSYVSLNSKIDTAKVKEMHVEFTFDSDALKAIDHEFTLKDDSNTIKKVAIKVTMKNAVYNLSEKMLTVTVEGNYKEYKVVSCPFVFTINGNDVRLNGNSDYIESDENGLCKVIQFDLSKNLFDIKQGDKVSLKYEVPHKEIDTHGDYLKDEAFQCVTKIDGAVTVELLN